MRIIAGSLKGRKLTRLKDDSIRPTPDRVRESIFNIIGASIIETSFLDLFAGTGAVGIEAMSRGAREVTAVDQSSSSIRTLVRNLRLCGIKADHPSGATPRFRVVRREALSALRIMKGQKRRFDLVFMDPPYQDGPYLPVLSFILECSILKKQGWIIAEHSSRRTLSYPEAGLEPFRSVRVGDTSFSLFERNYES